MSKIFKLNKEDLIVTEFQKNEGLFTLILIFKSDVEVRELTKDKLVSEFTKTVSKNVLEMTENLNKEFDNFLKSNEEFNKSSKEFRSNYEEINF